jgi:hypothetical protein
MIQRALAEMSRRTELAELEAFDHAEAAISAPRTVNSADAIRLPEG